MNADQTGSCFSSKPISLCMTKMENSNCGANDGMDETISRERVDQRVRLVRLQGNCQSRRRRGTSMARLGDEMASQEKKRKGRNSCPMALTRHSFISWVNLPLTLREGYYLTPGFQLLWW
ncbi:hypothetical protein K443DRAFT_554241 [Laccaria amethystina LaAM-08-1]|uniref:Uncharacterized protein n=1 Tax=Laccaria amethystina LaAM-08-1 TaxID=1095629 RepID=A0A0C9Y0L8_9AGAR|nr:hypothetical protein K443DRAFT_554241 [Laccaria amethystina LaAM-08-1]